MQWKEYVQGKTINKLEKNREFVISKVIPRNRLIANECSHLQVDAQDIFI